MPGIRIICSGGLKGGRSHRCCQTFPGEDRAFEFLFCGLAMRAVSYVHRNRVDHAAVQAQIFQLWAAQAA